MGVDINGTNVVDNNGNIDWARIKNKPTIPSGTMQSVSVSNCANDGAALSVSNYGSYSRITLSGGGYGDCSNCTSNCSNCVDCGSCFVAGTLVRMADGSDKPIEDVEVGDRVLSALGPVTVVDLWRPILGPRKLVRFADGKAATSGDHPIWGRDPKTKTQFWSTRDFDAWMTEVHQGIGTWFDGRYPYDLSGKPKQTFEFATLDGFKEMTWEYVVAPHETILYHLILDGGGSYFADGYLAVSQGDKYGIDWGKFHWINEAAIRGELQEAS